MGANNQWTSNAGRGALAPRITIRLSEAEHAELTARAKGEHQTIGEHVRARLGLTPRTYPALGRRSRRKPPTRPGKPDVGKTPQKET